MPRIPAVEPSPQGVYVPSDWGRHWRAALSVADTGTNKATISVVCDSIGHGYYTSSLRTKAWPQLMRAELQALKGDGGIGFLGVVDNLQKMPAITGYPGTVDWQALTGSWNQGPVNAGPSGTTMSSNVDGSTITYQQVRGTTISVYWVGAATTGTFSWTIDGASQGTVNTVGSNRIEKTIATGLSAGNHTVVITQVGTTGTHICGVSGENASGVILNMHGQAGQQSGVWSANAAWGGDVASWAGGANYPCNLLIWSLGANDLNASVTADGLAANARKVFDVVKDNSTTLGAVDILIVMPMVGRQWSGNTIWHDYCARMRVLAEHFGAAYVAFNPLYRNSWTYAQSQSFFSGVNGNSGAPGSDTVHISDVGAAAMWATVKAAVPQLLLG